MFIKTGKLPEHLSEDILKEFETIESYIRSFEMSLKLRKEESDVEIEYGIRPEYGFVKYDLWIFQMNIYVNNKLIFKKTIPYNKGDNSVFYGLTKDIFRTMFIYALDNMIKIKNNLKDDKRIVLPKGNKQAGQKE